jgi:hypothetical protein
MAPTAPPDILEPSLVSGVDVEFALKREFVVEETLGLAVVEETIGCIVVEVVVEERLESDVVEEKLDLLVQVVVLISLAATTLNSSNSYLN